MLSAIEPKSPQKYHNIFLLLSIVSSCLLLTATDSCWEDDDLIFGCTQPNACNFSTAATADDGTCFTCKDCTGSAIEQSSLFQSVDKNLFDNQFGSPYQGQVFAVLTIRWFKDEYCNRNDVNNFYLTFTSVINSSATFDYYIESNGNGQIRSAQGVVSRLPPGGTFEVFQGQSAFFNLKQYPIYVIVNSIRYG